MLLVVRTTRFVTDFLRSGFNGEEEQEEKLQVGVAVDVEAQSNPTPISFTLSPFLPPALSRLLHIPLQPPPKITRIHSRLSASASFSSSQAVVLVLHRQSLTYPFSSGDAMGASRLSGMQKQVLSLYRGFLRAARLKSADERKQIETIVSAEFRRNSKQVDRKNFVYIEYLLNRGKKQLDQLKSPGVVGLSSFNVGRS
ncbi:Succinate dehydrogenase assembly factor 1A, mitochondrial [Linum grandiflorum]